MTLITVSIILNVKLTLQECDNIENKIELLRKERNYTQQDLADLAEVSRQTIISLEKGKYNPSIILAYKIAKIFNTTIEEVFNLEVELGGSNREQ